MLLYGRGLTILEILVDKYQNILLVYNKFHMTKFFIILLENFV